MWQASFPLQGMQMVFDPCSTHKHDCQAICTIVVVSIVAAALACGSGNKAWLDAISRTWGLFYGRLTRVEAQWQ
jgi:hypothetical protein